MDELVQTTTNTEQRTNTITTIFEEPVELYKCNGTAYHVPLFQTAVNRLDQLWISPRPLNAGDQLDFCHQQPIQARFKLTGNTK